MCWQNVMIVVFFFTVSSISLAEKKDLKVQSALPKGARFLTPLAKLKDTDRMKFESLASIAKPKYLSQAKVLSYPVIFDLMASDAKFQKVIVFGSQRVREDLADKLYVEKDGGRTNRDFCRLLNPDFNPLESEVKQ